MEYEIKACGREHLEQILEILNDAILNSTALYDYKPRTMEMMESWFVIKEKGNYPVTGIFDASGLLLGFASYGSFRSWPAYKYTVEHSVYVRQGYRRSGLGKRLLQKLIEQAELQEYHVMVGGIDASNAASIDLHKQLGFGYAGTIKHAGYKFGKWLDLAFYQLILTTPCHPSEC